MARERKEQDKKNNNDLITGAKNEEFTQKQDIKTLYRAIEYLDYLINPSNDGFSMFAILSDDKDSENKALAQARAFSQYISDLSVQSGSITDLYSTNIPWELLKKLALTIKDEKDAELLKDDLKLIKEELEKIVKKKNVYDIKPADDSSCFFGIARETKSDENPISEEEHWQCLLFTGLSRNKFNEFLIFPQLEKALYKIFLEDAHNKLAPLVIDLGAIEHNLKNSEAILSITALAGELAKNILIFERYIPADNSNILKIAKDVRNAIEHAGDYADTQLSKEKLTRDFIAALKKLTGQVVRTFEALKEIKEVEPIVEQPDAKGIDRAEKAVAAIKESLPLALQANATIQEKLAFIKKAMLGEFEYRSHEISDVKKVVDENLVVLLKDNCQELENWQNVRIGIVDNIKIKADEETLEARIKVKNQFKALWEKAEGSIARMEEKALKDNLTAKEKFDLVQKYRAEKSLGIKKDFENLRIKIKQIKSEAAKIKSTAQPIIKNYENIRKAKKKLDVKFDDNTIFAFIKEFKVAQKNGGIEIAAQFAIITDSLKRIHDLTESLIKDMAEQVKLLRIAARKDRFYHQAVLFNLTAIGQAIQNLNHNNKFIRYASFELKKEFYDLRKLRNSIAHDQVLDAAGSMLSYYGNDLFSSTIQTDGGKAYDSAAYLASIKAMINKVIEEISDSKELDPLSDLEKTQYNAEYERYLAKELLKKSLTSNDQESALEILTAINHQISGQTRFSISREQHLNQIYYQNILKNDLKLICDSQESFEIHENCKSFLENNAVDTERECKAFKDYRILANKINLSQCQITLKKLGADLEDCKTAQDYFSLAKGEVVKSLSQQHKDELQFQLESGILNMKSVGDDEELLSPLGLETAGQYHWQDKALEQIKKELYKEGCSLGQRYMNIYLGKRESRGERQEFSEPDIFDKEDHLFSNVSNEALEDFKAIYKAQSVGDRATLIAQIKKHNGFLTIDADAQAFLKKASTLSIKDLYQKKGEIEKICQESNVKILGIKGKELLEYSSAKGKEIGIFIDAQSPHDIAKFKQKLCFLFRIKIKIFSRQDFAEYAHEEKLSEAEGDETLAKLQKVKLAHLQNAYELYAAVKKQDAEQVKQILDNGNILIDQKICGYTPLHLACMKYRDSRNPDQSIIQLLLDRGADPKIKDKHGNNMLHNAAQDGKLELIKLAVESGASPDSKNRHGKTALEMSLDSDKNKEIAKYLLPRTNLDNVTKLIFAMRQGNIEMVKKILPAINDINQKTKDGDTLLNIACSSYRYQRDNKLAIVKVLLQKGADIRIFNDQGNYALDALLEEPDQETYEIAKLLIEEEDSKVQDSTLQQAVHFADSIIMSLLLDNGASPNYCTEYSSVAEDLLGLRPYSFERLNALDKLQLLINNGLDLTNGRGEILIQIATKNNHTDAVNLIQSSLQPSACTRLLAQRNSTEHYVGIQ